MADVAVTMNNERRLVVDPMENILIGSDIIMRYLKIKSMATLYEYVETYGLPAIKRPDGMWLSSITAIDTWLFLAAEADHENRPHSRGYQQNMEFQALRLAKRIEEAKRQQEEGGYKPGPKPSRGRAAFDAVTQDHPQKNRK